MNLKAILMIPLIALFSQLPVESQIKKNEVSKNIPQNVAADKSLKSVQLVVTTNEIVLIHMFDVTCKISVSGLTVTESGVCYSINSGPTVNDNKVISSNKTGNMSILINSLDEGQFYYVRAYAKDGNNIIYGNEKSFKTDSKKESKPPYNKQKKDTGNNENEKIN
jgi:hypothetical protein